MNYPIKPTKPTLADAYWAKKTELLVSYPAYTDINFDEVYALKNEYVSPENAKSITFFVNVENNGGYDDDDFDRSGKYLRGWQPKVNGIYFYNDNDCYDNYYEAYNKAYEEAFKLI